MTEEKTFSVGVQTSSPKRISVTPNVSENPITASADTGLYYSQLAKNWAIGEGLIQNEDYSSKTWAGESKSSADLSKMYSEAASLDLNNLENRIIEYDEQLNTTITEGLENINTSVTSGVETIETLRDDSITEIETLRDDSLDQIKNHTTYWKENVAELGSKYVTDITNDSNKALYDIDASRTNSLAQISTLANTSISDIHTAGGSYDNLTYRNITNCLLEVPQRIKYTLENGTLTIHKGSVVIVPYGTEDLSAQYPVGSTFLNDNFTVYDTQYADGKFFVWAELVNDRSKTGFGSASTDFFVTINSSGEVDATTNTSSGSTAPTGSELWYDTANNIISYYSDGSLSNSNYTLPCIICSRNAGTIINVEQVFNGMGYIGSTIWVDKGIKYLDPNKRNEDGTLNNIEKTQDTLVLGDTSGNNANFVYSWGLRGNSIISCREIVADSFPVSVADNYTWFYYNFDTNKYYKTSGSTTPNWEEYRFIKLGEVLGKNITYFNPKQPFRAVDYNELPIIDICTNKATTFSTATSKNPAVVVRNYINGTSWSRVWSDGWIEQGGQVTSGTTGGTKAITLLESFTTTTYTVNVTAVNMADWFNAWGLGVNKKETSKITFYLQTGGTGYPVNWYACGY